MATDRLAEIEGYIRSQYNRLATYRGANTPRNTRPHPVDFMKQRGFLL